MTEATDDARDDKGRFAKGNPGGPGGQRRRPLRKVVSFEAEGQLWQLHYDLALTDVPAREFILRHLAGNPPQAAPEIPEGIDWPPITCTADLMGAVNAMLGEQRAGRLDGAGMKFLTGIILDLAKVFEAVELGPKVKRIEEALAAQAAMQGANG